MQTYNYCVNTPNGLLSDGMWVFRDDGMPKPQFTSLPTSPTLCRPTVIPMNVSLLWFYICCVKPCEIQAFYVCKLCFISPFDPPALYYLISEPAAENQQVTAPQMSVFVSLKFEVLEVV